MRGQILRRNRDKSLESSPPCYHSHPTTEFKPPPPPPDHHGTTLYIPANPWPPTTFQDDVTVIVLLGVSFIRKIQRRFDKHHSKMAEDCIHFG